MSPLRPPPTTDIIQYVAWLVWTCLTLTPAALKNPLYHILLDLSTTAALEKAFSALIFAPGLLEVLQSTTSPTVAYFKTLPSNGRGIWGVYLLVLEKKGSRSRIYIGSATSEAGGAQARFRQYDNGKTVPQYVQKALNDGYRIVHRGLLCWTPEPSAVKGFMLRTILLAIEATLSIVF
jgi:hypothetical protein